MISVGDLFLSVIVPRAIGGRYRPSTRISRLGWRTWRAVALRINDPERREDVLGMFAPALLVSLLVVWVALEILGFGLVFWALRAQIHPHPDLPSAIYYAGTSLLTIGYGDFAPMMIPTRLFSLIAGAAGLGTFAIVTTFLFQTFAAFQRRESFIVSISERTGAPPSGLEFVLRHVKLGLLDDVSPILREAQHWIAEVLETHLAYPSLTYFRSSHDDESWIGTLGAILDASTLLITTLDIDNYGQAVITLRLGTHLVRDFTGFFRLDTTQAVGVEPPEFEAAYNELREAGAPLQPLEKAWPAFAERRATYAPQLDTLARWWRIPPARWIGDRSRPRLHINVGITH
ncbi:MAG TPA: potassium channel family protein [Candidatus Sulfotelmatobacter sp.]|nr:potassium channel family protein [Candidatus Sulfotelmatobacter sp.]